MSETLYQLTAQMRQIEDALDETGGELTPELEELWQETGESLTQKVDNYFALIDKLTDYSDVVSAKIKRYQEMKKRTDNAVKRLKSHIMDTMIANGISKLEGADCKMSLSQTTATEVDEETVLAPYRSRLAKLDLPDWITADLKVSKTALKEAFKDKDVTPAGVSFVENQSLRIR